MLCLNVLHQTAVTLLWSIMCGSHVSVILLIDSSIPMTQAAYESALLPAAPSMEHVSPSMWCGPRRDLFAVVDVGPHSVEAPK